MSKKRPMMLRLPESIFEAIKKDAEKNDRTASAQAVNVLKKFYQDQTPTRRQVATKP